MGTQEPSVRVAVGMGAYRRGCGDILAMVTIG